MGPTTISIYPYAQSPPQLQSQSEAFRMGVSFWKFRF